MFIYHHLTLIHRMAVVTSGETREAENGPSSSRDFETSASVYA